MCPIESSFNRPYDGTPSNLIINSRLLVTRYGEMSVRLLVTGHATSSLEQEGAKLKLLTRYSSLQAFGISALLFIHACCIAGEDRSLEAYRLRLISQIIGALISDHVCRDEAECVRRQVVFVSPMSNGLAVEIYGVTSNSTMANVVSTVVREAAALPSSSEIGAKFIASTKEQSLGLPFWKPDSKLLVITIKGGANVQH
jgi:hypothetical protein